MEEAYSSSTLPGGKIRVADLSARTRHNFLLEPGAAGRAEIAAALGIPMIRKLRFEGRLEPEERHDWRLEAALGATVIQDCVATLDPVATRINETIVRRYLAHPPQLPSGDEFEMPQDENAEELPAELDLGAVLTEALALALPLYPHTPGLAPRSESFPASGAGSADGNDAKPFAALAAIRDKLG